MIDAPHTYKTMFAWCVMVAAARVLDTLFHVPKLSHPASNPIQSHRKKSLFVCLAWIFCFVLIFSCGHLRERGRQLFAQRLLDAAPPFDLGARRVQLLLRAHEIGVRRNVTSGRGG